MLRRKSFLQQMRSFCCFNSWAMMIPDDGKRKEEKREKSDQKLHFFEMDKFYEKSFNFKIVLWSKKLNIALNSTGKCGDRRDNSCWRWVDTFGIQVMKFIKTLKVYLWVSKLIDNWHYVTFLKVRNNSQTLWQPQSWFL